MPESRAVRVGPIERLLHLKALPLFGNLPPSELAVLGRHARERSSPKGAALMRAGEHAGLLRVIVRGRVRVESPGPKSVVLGPHDALGVLGVLAGAAEQVAATTLSETLTLELDRDILSDVVEDHFTILHHLLRGVARLCIDARRSIVGTAGYSSARAESVAVPARPLDLVERIFFLRRAMPLERASVTALAQLARMVEEVQLPPAELLWRQDDPSDALLLVASGEVSCVADGGRQRFRLGPGAAVGALDSLAEVPRWYEATTESKVVALRVRNQDFVDVLEDHFEMAMEAMATLARDAMQASPR